MRLTVRLLVGVVLVGALCGSVKLGAGEKKEPEKKSGTVTGVLTAKGPNFIEVKADGGEKARKYIPYWRGGAPAQGGGPDKKMLAAFKELKVGSRVRLEWEFAEHFRAVRVEVLRPAGKDDEKKDGEKK